jgi:hypothetical protein
VPKGNRRRRHTYRTQSRVRVSQTLTRVRQVSTLAVRPEGGAGWGSASRPDLRRGCRVTGIPTAILRLITRTDGARLLCFLAPSLRHLCYDSASRAEPLLPEDSMGGAGSGMWYRWNTRTTLDQVKRLDVRWLRRQGYLDGWPRWVTGSSRGREGGSVRVRLIDGCLVVEYRCRRHGTATWEDIRQVLILDWTSCHYGGQRPWCRCPRCQRRVAVLCGYDRLLLCQPAPGCHRPATMKHGSTVWLAKCGSYKPA